MTPHPDPPPFLLIAHLLPRTWAGTGVPVIQSSTDGSGENGRLHRPMDPSLVSANPPYGVSAVGTPDARRGWCI